LDCEVGTDDGQFRGHIVEHFVRHGVDMVADARLKDDEAHVCGPQPFKRLAERHPVMQRYTVLEPELADALLEFVTRVVIELANDFELNLAVLHHGHRSEELRPPPRLSDEAEMHEA